MSHRQQNTMTSLDTKSARLSTDNAPGQQGRRQTAEIEKLIIGEKLEGRISIFPTATPMRMNRRQAQTPLMRRVMQRAAHRATLNNAATSGP